MSQKKKEKPSKKFNSFEDLAANYGKKEDQNNKSSDDSKKEKSVERQG